MNNLRFSFVECKKQKREHKVVVPEKLMFPESTHQID